MGQQPNIELDISDLPRPTAHTAPARRWNPTRPGDLGAPGEVPSGGAFGTIGPDAGYALRLVRGAALDLAPNESLRNAQVAVATLAAARAARAGRAPTKADVEVAKLVLGYDRDAVPDDRLEELVRARSTLVAGIAHSSRHGTALIAAVDPEALDADPSEVRVRLASGGSPLSG